MKRILYLPLLHCFIASLLIFILVKPALAVYDPTTVPNNRFGIHILFPEEVGNAAKLVNSSGGDWGYVTIPIQSTDRNIDKWQKFLDDCRNLHLIPIIRLATYPEGSDWAKPSQYESLDWANFLNSLSWPIKNRYIIVYNETNRAAEWGGELRPDEYAQVLADTYDAFKRVSSDFFILNGGFDAAAPTNQTLMDLYQYLLLMNDSYPGIFTKIDGWASHSYPNPGFSGHPYSYTRMSIRSYQFELTYLQDNFGIYGLPVFITETGWTKNTLSEETIKNYCQTAFNEIWTDSYLISVNPFLLTAGGQFENFSWCNPDGSETQFYQAVRQMKKIKGEPKLSENKIPPKPSLEENNSLSDKKNILSNWPKLKNDSWKSFFNWLFEN